MRLCLPEEMFQELRLAYEKDGAGESLGQTRGQSHGPELGHVRGAERRPPERWHWQAAGRVAGDWVRGRGRDRSRWALQALEGSVGFILSAVGSQ